MTISTLGIDIAKSIFQLHGVESHVILIQLRSKIAFQIDPR
jgi:hypothetical protein